MNKYTLQQYICGRLISAIKKHISNIKLVSYSLETLFFEKKWNEVVAVTPNPKFLFYQ